MSAKTSAKLEPALISYMTLRRAVGIVGIIFPLILVVGSIVSGNCKEVQNTISTYYHTNMRDVFVGILSALALLLYAYKGYDRIDNITGNFGCIFALGTAFFPTSVDKPLTSCIPEPIEKHIIGDIHIISAGLLLLVLAFFSIFLFTKSGGKPDGMKFKRNKLYRICGYIMLGCIVLIAAYYMCGDSCKSLAAYNPIFWLETLALWAFGLSWLTKGKLLLAQRT